MTKNWKTAAALAATMGLGLGSGACGEDADEAYCAIILPLVLATVPQGADEEADYCLECDLNGDTYIVLNNYYEGIEAYPIESADAPGCGTLLFRPNQVTPPGDYVFQLKTYTVDETGEYPYGDGDYPGGGAGALSEATTEFTLTVTGEDCANGTDDDGDGGVDCEDQDNCAPTLACMGG